MRDLIRKRRPVLRLCMAAAFIAAVSCGDPAGSGDGDPHDELRADLATFPAPSHLNLVGMEETGPPSCIAGDCPREARFYLSERSLAATCKDVRAASNDWGLIPLDWTGDDGVFNACLGAGRDDSRSLSVSVFDAEKLPAVTSTDIDRTELAKYQSGVLIALSEAP
jgi:hypothetical protein